METEESGADGWGILHDRSLLPPADDYETLYLVGPLPAKELADLVMAGMKCACRKQVIPLFFPPGVSMMLAMPLPDVDVPADEPVH